MKVIIDADACPVKDIVIEETNSNTPVTLVSSIDHYTTKIYADHVNSVYVEKGADSADFKIVRLAKMGDIVITQDYGLASLLLGKSVTVLHHLGYAYTAENIDTLLASRHYLALARRQGVRTSGPKKLTEEDREKFRQLFLKTLG